MQWRNHFIRKSPNGKNLFSFGLSCKIHTLFSYDFLLRLLVETIFLSAGFSLFTYHSNKQAYMAVDRIVSIEFKCIVSSMYWRKICRTWRSFANHRWLSKWFDSSNHLWQRFWSTIWSKCLDFEKFNIYSRLANKKSSLWFSITICILRPTDRWEMSVERAISMC